MAADIASAREPSRSVPWPPYLRASAAWHAAAGVATIASPSHWPWALGAVLANHALVTGVGLWPRSSWLGSNWTRLPAAAIARREIAITIDDGPDPDVTPRMLDALDAAGARASFFCIGQQVARHAALGREIVRRGHSVENHSDAHSHRFSLFGPKAMRRDVEAAQARIADATGVAPRCFRAPAGLRNPFLQPVLDRLGLQYVSWTRRGFDTVRSDPRRVARRLTTGLAAGDILLLHDGHAARSPDGAAVSLHVLPSLLAAASRLALCSVTLPTAAANLSGASPTDASS